jgi:uncharacterized protein
MTTLAVIAKAPVAGRVKTRLCPPYTPAEAARLARAALADTLAAVRAAPANRRVLVVEGSLAAAGFDVVQQRGAGLGERLASAFHYFGGPAFLVGMDTPQLTPGVLTSAAAALETADAVIGPAVDGGYWGIGLRQRVAGVFDGVPMSEPYTCAAQRGRLEQLGLRTAVLPMLCDVDTAADAEAVARVAPGSRFARAYAAIGRSVTPRAA